MNIDALRAQVEHYRQLEDVFEAKSAEVERLQRQVSAIRETLTDFADPDHWSQDDEGRWVWYGFYPPFERPAIDLLGKLGNAKDG